MQLPVIIFVLQLLHHRFMAPCTWLLVEDTSATTGQTSSLRSFAGKEDALLLTRCRVIGIDDQCQKVGNLYEYRKAYPVDDGN